MEPFSIQCESCHAKLKVAKASLLGKRVPCPKCKALVVIPTASEIAIQQRSALGLGNESDRETLTEPTSDQSLGGFEDVDQLLADLPATTRQPDPAKQKPTPKRKVKRNPNPAPVSEATAEPIRPDQSWDNPAATQTRRVLARAAAALGATLFIAVGCYAWFSYTPTVTVAPAEEASSTEEGAKTKSAATELLADKKIDSASDLSDSTPPDEQPPEPPADTTSNLAQKESNLDQGTAKQPVVGSTPPPIDFSATTESDESKQRPQITSPVATRPSKTPDAATDSATTAPTTQPPTDEILQPVAAAESALSELSALLEDSGSSISAITDATSSVTAANTIGLPKYYFEAARSAPVNIERQLQLPCAGLRYADVPVTEILRDVTVISGVPITIDAVFVKHLDNDNRLIPNVSVDISETTFQDAIQQIAQQAGWTSQTTETGILLTDPNAKNVIEKSIDLNPIAELGDDGLDGVVDSIKAMIARQSWFSNPSQFKLERSGMTLNVQHVPAVVERVDQFIRKTDAAIQLTIQRLLRQRGAAKHFGHSFKPCREELGG